MKQERKEEGEEYTQEEMQERVGVDEELERMAQQAPSVFAAAVQHDTSVVTSSADTNTCVVTASSAVLPVAAAESHAHTSGWARTDLDALFELIRPTPAWTRAHAQPAALTCPLLPFQTKALAWMHHRETEAAAQLVADGLWETMTLHDGTKLWNHVAE